MRTPKCWDQEDSGNIHHIHHIHHDPFLCIWIFLLYPAINLICLTKTSLFRKRVSRGCKKHLKLLCFPLSLSVFVSVSQTLHILLSCIMRAEGKGDIKPTEKPSIHVTQTLRTPHLIYCMSGLLSVLPEMHYIDQQTPPNHQEQRPWLNSSANTISLHLPPFCSSLYFLVNFQTKYYELKSSKVVTVCTSYGPTDREGTFFQVWNILFPWLEFILSILVSPLHPHSLSLCIGSFL